MFNIDWHHCNSKISQNWEISTFSRKCLMAIGANIVKQYTLHKIKTLYGLFHPINKILLMTP